MIMSCLRLLVLAAMLASGCTRRATIAIPAADIVVAQNGSGNYTTIQEAVAAAGPGEVIYVKAGTYREALMIEKRGGIRLLGAGPGSAIVDAGGEYAALTLAGSDCRVEGFTFTGASSHGIYIRDGAHQVGRCLIVGNGDRGVYFSSFGGKPSARVEFCTVADNGVSGIYVPQGSSETAVTDCIIAFNGRGIVSDGDGGGIAVERNCVFETGSSFGSIKVGSGNIAKEPGFVNREIGDYRPRKNSPCIGAAANGANMGCF